MSYLGTPFRLIVPPRSPVPLAQLVETLEIPGDSHASFLSSCHRLIIRAVVSLAAACSKRSDDTTHISLSLSLSQHHET